jgi:hypothetical protein
MSFSRSSSKWYERRSDGARSVRLVEGIKKAYQLPQPDPDYDDRVIEICLSSKSLDILTRQQDEFTNALAEGLANIFARVWKGRLEQG